MMAHFYDRLSILASTETGEIRATSEKDYSKPWSPCYDETSTKAAGEQ